MDITDIQLRVVKTGGASDLFTNFNLVAESPTTSYILKAATGLDPDAIMNNVNYGLAVGAYIYAPDTVFVGNSLVPEPREVSMLIRLNPQYSLDETVSGLRDQLYKAISSNAYGRLELRFMNGNTKVASLFGYVSKLESSIFSKEPEVQLTVSCPQPWIEGDQITQTIFSGTDVTVVDNLSTAPHGFAAVFTSVGTGSVGPNAPYAFTNLYITNDLAGPAPFKMTYAFQAEDEIHFSSVEGNKYLKVKRGQNTIDIMDSLSSDSIWPMIYPGTNNIGLMSAISPDATWTLGYYFLSRGVDYGCTSIEYLPRYWGI